jgi:hypothetical protein
MTFDKWFEEQALWLKIVLLVIPFVGWVVEILIRVSAIIRKQSVINIVGLVIGVIGGLIWAIVDLVFVIISGNLLLLE